MNLTGNIMSMYNVFQNILTAAGNCDYSTIATNLGSLFKRIYSVAPIEAAAAIGDIDLEKSELYQLANSIYLGFAAFVKQQAFHAQVALDR
jgi:hypothetical protein